jgi:CelD/BcsL family acetyltransferase involved in cellulose biosynthesis
MYKSHVTHPREISSTGYPARDTESVRYSKGELNARLLQMSVFDFEALAAEWGQLASGGQNQAPFFQPYWFKAYAHTFAAGELVPTVVVRRAQALVGVLPLMYQKRFLNYVPARTMGSLSGVHSCRFDLVCADEDREQVAGEVWNCPRNDTSWSALEVRTLPHDGAFVSVLNRAAQDGFLTAWWPTLISPYLTLPAQGRDPFENCPAKHKADRKRLKKYEERLAAEGPVSFEVHSVFSEELFSAFLRLEGAGWKGKAGGAIACSPVVTQFYREVLQDAAREGHLRLCTLTAGEKLMAMERISKSINSRVISAS